MNWRRCTMVSTCLAALLAVGLLYQGVASAGSRTGIPQGFRGQALSWISPQQGWMLGVQPCGSALGCTTVLGTTDGGATWKTLGSINAPLVLEVGTGVTEVRFADALHGWAFLPTLWATKDGGLTWHRQRPPGDGRQVKALAGNSDGVYAVVSPCRVNFPCSDPSTLWKTTPGSNSWTQVSITLPNITSGVLKVYGLSAYLAAPAALDLAPDVLYATVDGQTWTSRPDPCHPSQDETLVDVEPYSDTSVALLCMGDPGLGSATKRVLRSDDNGQTTYDAGTTPRSGIISQIAATPDGTLAVSSWGAASSSIYLNDTGGTTWTTSVSLNDFGMGWNDIVFTTNDVGYVIYGPDGVYPNNRVGQLWKTVDGGVTWSSV